MSVEHHYGIIFIIESKTWSLTQNTATDAVDEKEVHALLHSYGSINRKLLLKKKCMYTFYDCAPNINFDSCH